MSESLHSDIIRVYHGLTNHMYDFAVEKGDEDLAYFCEKLDHAVTSLAKGRKLDSLPVGEIGVSKGDYDCAEDLTIQLSSNVDRRLAGVGNAMRELLTSSSRSIQDNPGSYLSAFSCIGYDAKHLTLFRNGVRH